MLGEEDVRLIRLFAAIVLGQWAEVKRIRAEAEPDPAWREAVLMSHLFAGFPRTVEAFTVLEEAGGLGRATSGGPGDGRALFDRIYGDLAEDVRLQLASFDPDLAGWIRDHAYGAVLARPGLSAARRELLAVAALAVTGQERQLMSHARGAVRCGASADDVAAAIEVVAEWIPDLDRTHELVKRFARQS